MSVETIPGTDLKYGLISYDSDGHERLEGTQAPSAQLIDRAVSDNISNIFFFCHGWQGDLPDAKDQYNRWMGALMRSSDRQHADSVFPSFNPLLIGLHWPSKPWGDEQLDASGSFGTAAPVSPDQLLRSYLDILGDRPAIRTQLQIIIDEARHNAAPESLPSHIRQAYVDLNGALGLESGGVEAPPDADREDFDPDESYSGPQSFGGWNLGGILGPLRQLSYWTMKKRARSIGESGMHDFLVKLLTATAARGTRIHLMGHSFGTIVVSSMLGGPNGQATLPRPIDSLVLVQGAVSLWSFASSIPFGDNHVGYFNRILLDPKVKGPIVTTQSTHDKAVGFFYPLASQGNRNVDFAVGDMPKYGGLGTFGIQGVANTSGMKMLDVDGKYGFAPKRTYNLESSQFIAKGSGLSGAHSDIDGPQVAHAIWEAAFASK